MQPIDRPFRFTWDFCVVWALLTVPAIIYVLSKQPDVGPWYSRIAFLIVVPFIATFFIYGPIMFMRLIFQSGARGVFVARIYLSIVLVAVIVFFGLEATGYYNEAKERMLALIFPALAIAYLHIRIDASNK
jgi:hypothetical protein